MSQFNFLDYGKPIEIIGGAPRYIKQGRTCVTFLEGIKKNNKTGITSEKTYTRINVSSDIAKVFKDKSLEIIDLGKSFAITPDENGRFRISGVTICGLNSETAVSIRDKIKQSLDKYGKVDAVRINDAYFFPHVPIAKED